MERALELARENELYSVMKNIAQVLIKFRKINEAINLIKEIDVPGERLQALVEITQKFMKLGKINEATKCINHAQKLIRGIRSHSKRFEAQMSIAQVLIIMGETEKAARVIEDARRILPKGDINQNWVFSNTLEIAQALAKVGAIEKAFRAIDEPINLAKKEKKSIDRFEKQMRIVQVLLEMKKIRKAMGIIEQALDSSREIKGHLGCVNQARVAKTLAEMGQTRKANRVINETIKSSKKIGIYNARIMAQMWIVKALVCMGKVEEAVRLAKEIRYFRDRFDIQAEIIRILLKRDEKEKAAKIVEEALITVNEIEFYYPYRFKALVEIAKFYVKLGKINEAQKLAEEIERPLDRFEVQARIAQALMEIGHPEKAKIVAIDSLDLSREVKSLSYKAFFYGETALNSIKLDPQILSDKRLRILLNQLKIENYPVEEYLALAEMLCLLNQGLAEPFIASDLMENFEFLKQNLEFFNEISEKYNLPRIKKVIAQITFGDII
jgi:tetratricopeptide (TPR) repeat protein